MRIRHCSSGLELVAVAQGIEGYHIDVAYRQLGLNVHSSGKEHSRSERTSWTIRPCELGNGDRDPSQRFWMLLNGLRALSMTTRRLNT